MPAVSEKQYKLMNAVAHNADFAKKVGIPQSVGREFDTKGYKEGGEIMATDEMNAEHTACELCGGKHPKEMACGGGMAEGGEIEGTYDHDREIEIPDHELDRVLDEVISMTEDPDNEYEIESAINKSEESKGEEHPTEARIEEIEESPAPEEFDEVERMAHEQAREEDARKPRTYGMSRNRNWRL